MFRSNGVLLQNGWHGWLQPEKHNRDILNKVVFAQTTSFFLYASHIAPYSSISQIEKLSMKISHVCMYFISAEAVQLLHKDHLVLLQYIMPAPQRNHENSHQILNHTSTRPILFRCDNKL